MSPVFTLKDVHDIYMIRSYAGRIMRPDGQPRYITQEQIGRTGRDYSFYPNFIHGRKDTANAQQVQSWMEDSIKVLYEASNSDI
ncbi:MAG: hypothetical protein ACLR2O_04015 [Coprococcus sp.]